MLSEPVVQDMPQVQDMFDFDMSSLNQHSDILVDFYRIGMIHMDF
jgi:hypothetical protein